MHACESDGAIRRARVSRNLLRNPHFKAAAKFRFTPRPLARQQKPESSAGNCIDSSLMDSGGNPSVSSSRSSVRGGFLISHAVLFQWIQSSEYLINNATTSSAGRASECREGHIGYCTLNCARVRQYRLPLRRVNILLSRTRTRLCRMEFAQIQSRCRLACRCP